MNAASRWCKIACSPFHYNPRSFPLQKFFGGERLMYGREFWIESIKLNQTGNRRHRFAAFIISTHTTKQWHQVKCN